MSAIFKIDQPGAIPPFAGMWDRASRDIQLVGAGGPTLFTAQDGTAASYLWELISEPPGPATPIVNPTAQICQVSFVKTGGYLMQLTVNAGIPATEDVSVRYVGIRLPNSNLPIPAFNELDFDNSIDPAGAVGTSEKLTEFFKWVDAHIGSGLGNLPQTLTVYVDGGRTDIYVEDGTFAFPFKTIQPAINLAQTLADAEHGEACVHIRPWVYTDVNTVLPSNVHIDAEMGASLMPAGPSHGLIVIPGNFNTRLGVTFIRGLTFSGDGGGIWPTPSPMWGLYLPSVPLPPGVNPITVVPIDCGIGALQNACGICVEQGAVYLSDAGGMFSDSAGGTNAIAVRVGPPGGGPPMFGAIVMVGMFNLSASETMFDIRPGGAVLATGTNLSNNSGTLSDAVVRIDGGAIPGLGAIFVGKNLRVDGDAASMVKETGNAFVLLDTSAGNLPTMGNFVDDIFDIRQGNLSLSGGAYRTNGGNGLALRATDGPVSCWTRDVDVIADDGINDVQVLLTENEVNLQTYNTRFRGENFVPGRTYARMSHTLGSAYLDGGIIEGGSGGGPASTVLDLVSGMTWLTGGIDLNANQWSDIALHVAAGATVLHGHANVRVGQVVVDPGGFDYALPSSFGGLQVGRYNSIIKFVARATLAEVAAEPDYPHGSIVIETGDPTEPRVYINYGTDLARDWRLLDSGSPIERVQKENCGISVPLNGTTRGVPAILPWVTTDYLDSPPFSVLSPMVMQVTEEGDYCLSYHVIWQNDALLAFGTTVAVMWEMSTDGGGSWLEITPTLSYDSTPNVFNNYGANDLAPFEIHLLVNTQLRVKAYLAGVNGNVFIDAFGPGPVYENGSWVRIARGGNSISGSPDNYTVMATGADLVPAYLDDKLEMGLGMHKSISTPGGNEKVRLDAVPPFIMGLYSCAPGAVSLYQCVQIIGPGIVGVASRSGVNQGEARGVIWQMPTPTSAVVAYAGEVTDSGPTPWGFMGGLIPGATYYLDVNGAISLVPSVTLGELHQRIGVAKDATTLVVDRAEGVTL